MKKIFALILCLMLLCAMPLATFAEGEEVTEDTTVTEEETIPEQTEPAPAPEEETGTDWEGVKDTLSGAFVEWVEPNIEEIGVVVTLIGYGVMLFKKFKNVLKSLGTMNNNTITISQENANLMEQAMASINNASGAVTGYEDRIKNMLEAYEKLMEALVQTAEDKQRLENELIEIKNYLKTSTDANVEFANELAELLGLANIPNYKKEEIGARHLESVKAIIEAEKKAEGAALLPASTEEVKEIVGEEKKD